MKKGGQTSPSARPRAFGYSRYEPSSPGCCAAWAAGAFGSVTVRMPLRYTALTASASTSDGSRSARSVLAVEGLDVADALRVLVLHLRGALAADRQHAVLERDLDVLLLETGQLGGDAQLGVGLGEVDARRVGRRAARRRPAPFQSWSNTRSKSLQPSAASGLAARGTKKWVVSMRFLSFGRTRIAR